MRVLLLALLITTAFSGFAQNLTDVSLFLKKDKSNYLTEIESESGNMFTKLGHHGPAVENQYLGFRFYFDKKTAIDIYSKAKPGLEIRDKKWYPSKKEQRAGYGPSGHSGSVRVYDWDGSNHVQRGGDIDGVAVIDYFGGLEISDDGLVLAIGSELGTGASGGSVRVYDWCWETWGPLLT